jgi:hypothetical protein
MFDSGIRRLNDIIQEDGSLLEYESFVNIYPHLNINFLEYNSMIHAIKTWMKNNLCVKTTKLTNPLIMSNIHIVLKCKQLKLLYEILNKNTSNAAGKTKWGELFEINDKEWKFTRCLSKYPKTANSNGFNIGLFTESSQQTCSFTK